MGLVTAASAIAFLTTEMDDILVLFVLFSRSNGKKENAAIISGKYLALMLLVASCKTASPSLLALPYEQLFGLLGILPIIIGIRFAINEFSAESSGPSKKAGFKLLALISIMLESLVIGLANGGDSISVCATFFSSLASSEFIISCAVFSLMQALWCVIALSVINADSIHSYIEESKGVVVPALFVTLGLYILVKSGSLVWLFSLGVD